MPLTAPLAKPLARPLARPLAGYGDFGYDPDSWNYFIDAGVTDPQLRLKLYRFIQTIKANAPWEDVRAYVFYKGMQREDGDIITIGGWSPNVDASTVGSPVLTNSGINLNSSSQYVVDDADVYAGGTQLTLLADYQCISATSPDDIIAAYSTTGDQRSWRLAGSATSSGQLQFVSSSSGGAGPSSLTIGTSLQTTNRQTLGVIYSSGTVSAFVNGSATATSGSSTPSLFNTTAPITIGAFGDPGGYFGGTIACVIAIKSAITQSQFQAIHDAMTDLRFVYDPDAEAFFNAAGIVNGTQRDAINELVVDLKSENLWPKFSALYPFVGGTASSHSYNLINPSTFQITWNGTVTHNSNGITGDGSTGYGDTGYNPVSESASSMNFSLSVYTRGPTAANGTTRVDLSAQESNTKTTTIGWLNGGTWAAGVVAAAAGSTSFVPESNTTQREGLNSVIVNGSVTQAYYNQGTLIGTRNKTDSGHPNYSIYVIAQNASGTAGAFSLKNVALSAIGQGRSDAEELSFATIVQKFQTALGRAV